MNNHHEKYCPACTQLKTKHTHKYCENTEWKPIVSKGPKVNWINPELFFITWWVFVMDIELLHS